STDYAQGLAIKFAMIDKA
ncbi:unnamed protein product, partial [Rotaria sp. Silwood2]